MFRKSHLYASRNKPFRRDRFAVCWCCVGLLTRFRVPQSLTKTRRMECMYSWSSSTCSTWCRTSSSSHLCHRRRRRDFSLQHWYSCTCHSDVCTSRLKTWFSTMKKMTVRFGVYVYIIWQLFCCGAINVCFFEDCYNATIVCLCSWVYYFSVAYSTQQYGTLRKHLPL